MCLAWQMTSRPCSTAAMPLRSSPRCAALLSSISRSCQSLGTISMRIFLCNSALPLHGLPVTIGTPEYQQGIVRPCVCWGGGGGGGGKAGWCHIFAIKASADLVHVMLNSSSIFNDDESMLWESFGKCCKRQLVCSLSSLLRSLSIRPGVEKLACNASTHRQVALPTLSPVMHEGSQGGNQY